MYGKINMKKKNSVNEGYIIGTLGNGEANILVNQVGLQAKLKNYININGLTGEAYLHKTRHHYLKTEGRATFKQVHRFMKVTGR